MDIVEVIPSIHIESVYERQFDNRYGECIKEDIITIIKHGEDADIDFSMFEQVGMNHIKNALSYADSELEDDLLAVLCKKDLVVESPIY